MGRFIPNDETWVGFTPTLTGSVTAPKVADVTGEAVVDLTHYCTGINASTSGNDVPTPAFDELFETSITGTAKGTFSADFYRDDEDDLAWDTLPRRADGYFLIRRYGGKPTKAGDKLEIWPVRILSRSVANMTSNTVVSFTVQAAVPEVPNEDAVLAS